MRRLARRLFTLCSAVSLLLCVVWVLSYRTAYSLDWYSKFKEAPPTTGLAYAQVLWRVAAGGGSIVVVRADRCYDLHEAGWAWDRSPVKSLNIDAFPADSVANRL